MLPVRNQDAESTTSRMLRKQVRAKPGLLSLTRKKTPTESDKDPITFYKDDDDSFEQSADHDDAIKAPSPVKTVPFPTPGPGGQELVKHDSTYKWLQHDSWSSLYEELKIACYSVGALPVCLYNYADNIAEMRGKPDRC